MQQNIITTWKDLLEWLDVIQEKPNKYKERKVSALRPWCRIVIPLCEIRVLGAEKGAFISLPGLIYRISFLFLHHQQPFTRTTITYSTAVPEAQPPTITE